MPHACRSSRVVVCTLLALLLTPPTFATSALRLSEDELIDRAELVVVGRCTGSAGSHAGRRIVTLAAVEVEDALKGRARGRRLTVLLPGGVDLDARPPVAEVWPGGPTLARGERAVLFLRPAASVADGWTLVGFAQGKLPVLTEDGVAFVLHDQDGARAAATSGDEREPLAELAARVRARAAAGTGQGTAR